MSPRSPKVSAGTSPFEQNRSACQIYTIIPNFLANGGIDDLKGARGPKKPSVSDRRRARTVFLQLCARAPSALKQTDQRTALRCWGGIQSCCSLDLYDNAHADAV